MKLRLALSALLSLPMLAQAAPAASPLLVIHGGAGVERKDLSPAEEKAARDALRAALLKGHAELAAGRPALAAVTAAITVLEDDPTFNAGKGAVAGVQRVRNPILLAQTVMQKSRHVMMVGQGAEAFAAEQGIPLVDPSYFRTEKRWQQLQRALKEEASGQAHADLETAKHFGTVGAVALDAQGHLAAGTSTGGMTNKRYGRVGDSPIIGAGTWADARCAVSGTGWGEYYIRTAAAHEICARMRYQGQSPEQAGKGVINETIPQMGGDGGAIVLGADGKMATPFNTQGMYRGWIGGDGVPHVAIFANETLPVPGQ